MFDRNEFKRKVKTWIREHPDGSEQDLVDYCDEIIPANQFGVNQWLVEQTLSWYKFILATRDQKNQNWQDDTESAD